MKIYFIYYIQVKFSMSGQLSEAAKNSYIINQIQKKKLKRWLKTQMNGSHNITQQLQSCNGRPNNDDERLKWDKSHTVHMHLFLKLES